MDKFNMFAIIAAFNQMMRHIEVLNMYKRFHQLQQLCKICLMIQDCKKLLLYLWYGL